LNTISTGSTRAANYANATRDSCTTATTGAACTAISTIISQADNAKSNCP
jgi:hypothetical protein